MEWVLSGLARGQLPETHTQVTSARELRVTFGLKPAYSEIKRPKLRIAVHWRMRTVYVLPHKSDAEGSFLQYPRYRLFCNRYRPAVWFF